MAPILRVHESLADSACNHNDNGTSSYQEFISTEATNIWSTGPSDKNHTLDNNTKPSTVKTIQFKIEFLLLLTTCLLTELIMIKVKVGISLPFHWYNIKCPTMQPSFSGPSDPADAIGICLGVKHRG
eukprot:11063847-Ditylum_brightwellii.AAC.1